MVSAEWVLLMMLKAEPTSPIKHTFAKTALAIARAAERDPLFAGPLAAERTAAQLVSVAWFESHFKPDAIGDHDRRADGTKGEPRSFCAMQIGKSNFAALGITRAEILGDIDVCIDAGLRMMHISYAVCRGIPIEERLAHYAGGGGSCPIHNADAVRKSKHRVAKSHWLFRAVPPPTTTTTAAL